MPDQSRYPVWFVENVLRKMFVDQARTKGYNIDKINHMVSSTAAARSPINLGASPVYCAHCKKKLSTNSKPVPCPRCKLQKHSTKCLPCPLSSNLGNSRSIDQNVLLPPSSALISSIPSAVKPPHPSLAQEISVLVPSSTSTGISSYSSPVEPLLPAATPAASVATSIGSATPIPSFAITTGSIGLP